MVCLSNYSVDHVLLLCCARAFVSVSLCVWHIAVASLLLRLRTSHASLADASDDVVAHSSSP